MHEELANHLAKLAQEEVWLSVLTVDCPVMTIAVDWDVKNQTKQTIFITKLQLHSLNHVFLIVMERSVISSIKFQ